MLVIKIPKSSSCGVLAHFALFTQLLLLVTTTSTIEAASSNSALPPSGLDDTLPVHNLRSVYELVQSKSWRLIEQQWAAAPKLSDSVRSKIIREVFAYHNDFVVQQLAAYERDNKDQLRTAFPEFNHFYEWNYVQGHINATNSLFEVFRNYVAGSMNAATDSVTDRGARDFAETVLYDKKWPIEKSFNDIHHIMVGQGLYYKMALVLFPQSFTG